MGGKTSTEAKQKFIDKTYDVQRFRTRKDVLTTADVQAAAKKAGMSYAEFCQEAILEKMQRIGYVATNPQDDKPDL